jgi:hypothetical protein
MFTIYRNRILIVLILAGLTGISCFRSIPQRAAVMQVENKKHFGLLQGLVKDEYDQPIPGANVFIRKLLIGTNADTLGNYTLHNIPPGIYEVEAIQIGYKKIIIPDIEIHADSTTILNISTEVQPMIFPQIIIDPNRK